MRKISTIYICGPGVWFPEPMTLAAAQRALCEAAGFTALTGSEDRLVETEPSEVMAREIYAQRLASMRRADAAIVDLTPWRGPSCDPGAAFEAGVLSGLGKPVFAYLNVPGEDDAEYRERVDAWVGAQIDEAGVWRDGDGCEVEDFGLPETLMLWAEARRLYVIVTPQPLGDLTGFQLCLDAVRLYSD